MDNKNLISLGELAIEMGINKSKLSYYATEKLIVPNFVVGKMFLFDKQNIKGRIKKIESLKNQGLKLKEIREKLNENQN